MNTAIGVFEAFNPNMYGYTATPGTLQYWPEETGPTKLTAVGTMDFMKLKADYDAYTAAASTYNTDKDSYNTLKTAYNKALADEKTRKADVFKAAFDPPVTIPTRPCQPT